MKQLFYSKITTFQSRWVEIPLLSKAPLCFWLVVGLLLQGCFSVRPDVQLNNSLKPASGELLATCLPNKKDQNGKGEVQVFLNKNKVQPSATTKPEQLHLTVMAKTNSDLQLLASGWTNQDTIRYKKSGSGVESILFKPHVVGDYGLILESLYMERKLERPVKLQAAVSGVKHAFIGNCAFFGWEQFIGPTPSETDPSSPDQPAEEDPLYTSTTQFSPYP